MYRRSDLQFIQEIFDRTTNDIAIVYGFEDYALGEIVADFIRDKECLYYKASPVTDDYQRMMFAAELHEQTRTPVFPDYDYDKLLASYIDSHNDKKKVIVIYDFEYLIKENPTFINFLSNMLFGQLVQGRVMFLLVSDDVKWIESDMIKLIGRKSSEISRVIKLKEFSFTEFCESFDDVSEENLIKIYSVIGGRSLFYNMITDDSDVVSVIKDLLKTWMKEDYQSCRFLPGDIREPVIYNTLLAHIASGTEKLNDLHKAMNMDRAKLSAYLKTLERGDIIEKLEGARVGDNKNIKKGTYRIKDKMIWFYYRFVFGRLSSLKIYREDRFYKKFIEADLPEYIDEIYPQYCMEHIKWLYKENRLNFKIETVEEYFDKTGAIDFVIVVKGGYLIACGCNYSDPVMGYDRLCNIREVIKHNRLPCDNIWLYSAGGFDTKLTQEAERVENIKLLELYEQTVR